MDVTFEDRLLSLERDDRRSTFGKIALSKIKGDDGMVAKALLQN